MRSKQSRGGAGKRMAVLGLLLGTGCATFGTTTASHEKRFRTLTIVEQAPTVEVPRKHRDGFQRGLEKALVGSKITPFRPGPELTMSWRFTEFSTGGQTIHWILGRMKKDTRDRLLYDDWRATLTVQASFFDPAGRHLATTETVCAAKEGAIDASAEDLMRECVAAITRFARERFR